MTGTINFKGLEKLAATFEERSEIPVLFVGHGSPMNAIEENEFVKGWRTIGQTIPKPNAILCISAHWETRGTFITAMEKPKTIHDFGGFPKALFEVEYPAPGDPALAKRIATSISEPTIGLDSNWGLDHGCWSVVKHLYPAANVPVLQMSIDYRQPPQYHYELAKQLATIRKKGVLIIGSGNIVHNLRALDWNNPDGGFDWAATANDIFKRLVLSGDHQQLINYTSLGREVAMSVPGPDHYLPLLYTLGLKEEKDAATVFNDKLTMGAISMTSFKIG